MGDARTPAPGCSARRSVPELPIAAALPALQEVLRSHPSAVLQASPGAGKTTRVPLALLHEPWLAGQRVVMLEPRRLAARAAARYMADVLGERVGETVGYRVRMDTRVGPRTRVEVVTEGVLTRLLQADPGLEGVALVIFDEFHERSLHADLGLALCLQCRSLLRPDLRILVMSATLDGEAVAALLNNAPIVTSEGRSFPVETRHVARRADERVEPAVVRTVLQALDSESGDLLVFLPGAGEIHRVEERLADAGTGPGVWVAPLYGDLPQEAQDRAFQPSPPGRRKVVLATSIAETSLTIEGIRVVIDSGLVRVPRFSPRTGMSRLETLQVSQASADQRRGRAGRLGPGVCLRLWPEHQPLVPHGKPEILEADLAPLALELAAWGVSDPAELAWLNPPPAGAFAQARELLTELGAVEDTGAITAHGRRMAEMALHPRLAHMLLRAQEVGADGVACDLAALLSERDLFRGEDARANADVRHRLAVLRGDTHGSPVDRASLQRVRAEARHWRKQVKAGSDDEQESVGLLLAFAYPDRLAQRRRGQVGHFLLRNGRGAGFAEPQPLAESPYLVAAELGGKGSSSQIFLAAPLALAEIEVHFAEQMQTEELIAWDAEAGAVRALRRTRLGALILGEAPLRDADPERVAAALLHGILQAGVGVLPWTGTARHLQQRIAFLRRLDPAWPDVSDEALTATLGEWLAPYAQGMRRLDELRGLDMMTILQGMLAWEQRSVLDEQAPTHWIVPSGSRIRIDYSDPARPTLAARLQEMFGLRETPRIARGAVPLTLQLLSPAGRPVQVTQDLASFWRTTYFDVKRDLKGRYPRHYWPEDPMQAIATHRVRPRA